MKKTIQTAELQNALNLLYQTAQTQIADGAETENEQMKNHGYGLEDAVTMMKILLHL